MTEANFSFTTKLGGDLLTVRGNTPDEFKKNLEAAVLGDLTSYASALQEAARKASTPTDNIEYAKQALGATVTPAAQSTPNPWTQPAPAPAAPAGDGPTCSHGAMTYREGVSGPNAKNPGQPYKMWVCPSRNRDEQCKPVWVR